MYEARSLHQCFNRTFMELKRAKKRIANVLYNRFNRTFMELKPLKNICISYPNVF